jgi:hypothetical protein
MASFNGFQNITVLERDVFVLFGSATTNADGYISSTEFGKGISAIQMTDPGIYNVTLSQPFASLLDVNVTVIENNLPTVWKGTFVVKSNAVNVGSAPILTLYYQENGTVVAIKSVDLLFRIELRNSV